MSALCMILLRNTRFKNYNILLDFVQAQGYGVDTKPQNSLLAENPNLRRKQDLVLELTDSPNSDCCELLIGYDNCSYNGLIPQQPMVTRMKFIQDVLGECLKLCKNVELFISDDNGCVKDYTEHHTQVSDVANKLLCEYSSVEKWSFYLPNIHLFVTRE